MDSLEQKIGQVRKFAKGKEDFEELANEWEGDLDRLTLWNEYKDHDCSIKIKEQLMQIVISINKKLLEVDDPAERKALKADKQRCEWLLKIYCKDYAADMKQIEADVDESLSKLI